MDSADSPSIIHKKARVGREGFHARAMSPAKALRLSLAKAADEQLDLPLVVKTLEQMVVPSDVLLKNFDGSNLLILLDGQGGARGAAMLDSQIVSALIEKQISGNVRAGAAGPRHYTRTDAAIVAPLLDATLVGFDVQQKSHDENYQPGSFRFGDKVDDIRSLSLALDGGRFDFYRLSVELEEGAKSGMIMLALPCRATPKTKQQQPKSKGRMPPPQAGIEQQALEAAVSLDVVLGRIEIPLHDIWELEPGAVLPIPLNNLRQVELVARPDHAAATARLGQINGMRAVRVNVPDHEGLRASQLVEGGQASGARDVTPSAPPDPQPAPALDMTMAPEPLGSILPGTHTQGTASPGRDENLPAKEALTQP